MSAHNSLVVVKRNDVLNVSTVEYLLYIPTAVINAPKGHHNNNTATLITCPQASHVDNITLKAKGDLALKYLISNEESVVVVTHCMMVLMMYMNNNDNDKSASNMCSHLR